MKKQAVTIFFGFVIFSLLVAGCGPAPTLVMQTQTSSAVSYPNPSETPTRIQLDTWPTPTFPPSITSVQESNLIRLLNDKSCQLPCYLGITPGKTSWDETQKILKDIGALPGAESWGDRMRTFEYSVWIDNPMVFAETPSPNAGKENKVIYLGLGFSVWENKVHRIVVDVSADSYTQKLSDYWMNYSLENIFLQLGAPDFISFSKFRENLVGVTEFLVYKNAGVVIQTLSAKKGNMICPISLDENPRFRIWQTFTLTNVNFELDIYYPGAVLPTDQDIYQTIIDTLGITEQEYYTKVTSDPSSCFDIEQ